MTRFDAAAGNWDIRRRSSRAAVVADEIRSVTLAKAGTSALEYGCGTGLVSFNLTDHFQRIVLMDSSSGMLNALTEKIQQSGHTHMYPLSIDLTTDTYTAQKFDVIYTPMVLHHIQDTAELIRSFYALLNPDGILCVIDLDEDDGRFHAREPEFNGHHGFSHDSITDMLKSSGFENTSVQTFFMDAKEIGEKTVAYSLFRACGTKI